MDGINIDDQMIGLEMEWRQAYEASMAVRADYQALTASASANAELLDHARERLERSEALKARIMHKIERLEERLFGMD